jgi:hypothetical protein
MSLLFLPEKHHIRILHGCADTCVLEKGWEISSVDNSRRVNVVGLDHEAVVKKYLSIVSAIITVDLPKGQPVLLVIHEAIHNVTSNHSMLSEFPPR